MDEKYMDKTPSRAVAWVFLILASIVALVDVYFWLPFYRTCQKLDHNVLEAIKVSTTQFALFAGVFAVYFIFSVIANIKFSRAGRYWGRSFGGFLGRFIILLEYAVYVVAILAFFFG